MSSSISVTTGKKRPVSHSDPERDKRKRQRRMGSPAAEALQALTSNTTPDTHATIPDTGFAHVNDASGNVISHEIERFLAHRAKPAHDGVSAQAHSDFVHEVKQFRETLAQTKCALEAVQTLLQMMEQHHPRLEGQLDALIRMMILQYRFLSRRERLHVHAARDLIWLEHANVKHGMGCNLRGKLSVYTRLFLTTTVKGPIKRGRNFV